MGKRGLDGECVLASVIVAAAPKPNYGRTVQRIHAFPCEPVPKCGKLGAMRSQNVRRAGGGSGHESAEPGGLRSLFLGVAVGFDEGGGLVEGDCENEVGRGGTINIRIARHTRTALGLSDATLLRGRVRMAAGNLRSDLSRCCAERGAVRASRR